MRSNSFARLGKSISLLFVVICAGKFITDHRRDRQPPGELVRGFTTGVADPSNSNVITRQYLWLNDSTIGVLTFGPVGFKWIKVDVDSGRSRTWDAIGNVCITGVRAPFDFTVSPDGQWYAWLNHGFTPADATEQFVYCANASGKLYRWPTSVVFCRSKKLVWDANSSRIVVCPDMPWLLANNKPSTPIAEIDTLGQQHIPEAVAWPGKVSPVTVDENCVMCGSGRSFLTIAPTNSNLGYCDLTRYSGLAIPKRVWSRPLIIPTGQELLTSCISPSGKYVACVSFNSSGGVGAIIRSLLGLHRLPTSAVELNLWIEGVINPAQRSKVYRFKMNIPGSQISVPNNLSVDLRWVPGQQYLSYCVNSRLYKLHVLDKSGRILSPR